MQSGIFPEAIKVLHEHTQSDANQLLILFAKKNSFVEKALSCLQEKV